MMKLRFIIAIVLIFAAALSVNAADEAPGADMGIAAETGAYDETQRIPDTYATQPRVVDDAGLLTTAQKAVLESRIAAIAEKYAFDVVILTENTYMQDVVARADDFFDYNGYGYGVNRDGVLFYVNLYERDWVFSTSGRGIYIFTDYGCDYIGGKVAPYLTDGYYAGGFNTLLDCAEDFLAEAIENRPYDIDNRVITTNDYARRALIIALCALIIPLFILLPMKASMSTAKPKRSANDYMAAGSFNLTSQRDIFTHSTVRKVPRNTNTGGGRGGSSIHVGSSGRSHGGSRGKF
jgi:uncharacterized protein